MTTNDLLHRRGHVLDLGACLVGTNLNLLVVRGFCVLDALADISAPDIYDMKDNPKGTQRDLKVKHANECFVYAMNSQDDAPEDMPRCFPEIILNARDVNVVEIYNLSDPSEFLDVSSFTDIEELPHKLVGVRVRISDLEFPKPTKSPQISRVDGNHRMAKADDVLQDPDWDIEDPEAWPDFPTVPFSLLIGLNQNQEARLFRDINGEHEGMETAHLDSMMLRISTEATLKADKNLRPLWLAHQLAQDGRAFEGQVFFGGSKLGVKKAMGSIPPIKINALKAAVGLQLRSAPSVSVQLEDKPDQLMVLLDRYWQAVRETFPEEWQDRKSFVLLQSIGLNAFAKFGGIILDRAWNTASVEVQDFKHVLETVKQKVSLKRDDYKGIAGAGGAGYIADRLIAASDPDHVQASKVLNSLSASLPAPGIALDD